MYLKLSIACSTEQCRPPWHDLRPCRVRLESTSAPNIPGARLLQPFARHAWKSRISKIAQCILVSRVCHLRGTGVTWQGKL